MFQRDTLPSSLRFKNKLSDTVTKAVESLWVCLPPAFTLVSCSAYSLAQKIDATYFSEMLVDLEWTTRRYIPENTTPQNAERTSNPMWTDFVYIGI
jgi:hypothetical protein